MGQRHRQTDGTVSAHAQHRPCIKVDHARHATRIDRLHQQRAYHGRLTARLQHQGAAEVLMLLCQPLGTLGQGAGAKLGPALDNDACRFAAGMAVDHTHSVTTPPCRDQSANQLRKSVYCASQ